jgi:hypothetical protein
MIWQLSQQQQSSENESLLAKYRAGVSAMHYRAREIVHHFKMKRVPSTITISADSMTVRSFTIR